MKTYTLWNLCLLLVSLFIIVGCASTSDIDSLKNTVAHLQIESIAQKKEIEALKEQSKEIGRLRDRFESVYALRESQTNLLTQTSDFSKELQNMKGRFDEYRHQMEKIIKDMHTEREVQNAKITAIERELREIKTKPPAEKPADSDKQKDTEKETAQQDDQRLYDDAQIDFKEKKYASARQKFEKFIKENPDHKLVSNSHFWIAETFYNEKKYEDAILAYETFIKKYPKHDKIRSAMLKQGYAFVDLGDKKTGKIILERLIEKYPRTQEADLAEKKIAEMLSQNKKQTKSKQVQKKRQ
ncbi:MAG: tol-pal system protein YbgF [Thermodesulfovibrionales bacterium]